MVLIKNVGKNTPAYKVGVQSGDELLSINDNEIYDVLDYQFYATEEHLSLLLRRDGETFSVECEKPMYDDLGLEFETYLMDKKRRCKNGCIFCFIDQNPKGMRETIYFKDDDERLSFLQGNYITLTNLEERDLDRIIKMHISPINVSVHTTDPELRVRMMKNKNAGKVLELMKKLQGGGVLMNAQIVLCRGYNDGDALKKTLLDLRELFPQVQSVAVVPSGITSHRDGLEKLIPFDKESCRETLELINSLGDENLKTLGHRIFFASDEFYLGAELPLPDEDYYEGYMQLDNGVGSLRSHREEFLSALENEAPFECHRTVTVATGKAASAHITELCLAAEKRFAPLKVNVVTVENRFFGENITVSGLVVGRDLIDALKGRELGERLLIPKNMLRSDGDLFLDDVSVDDVEKELGVPLVAVGEYGDELLYSIID
ncbi:MAG: DUF512 domain-containing protein [Clostridia bacterium]|nr:DUF512 domain-containing protein [Clostridia bacterium]